MKPKIACISSIASALMTVAAHAQEPTQVSIPAANMSCLVENQDKYLNLPRNVVIFFAEYCPAVSRIEVAEMVQNSAVEGKEAVRLFIRKQDFLCLVGKIKEHMDTAVDTQDSRQDRVIFTLDCD